MLANYGIININKILEVLSMKKIAGVLVLVIFVFMSFTAGECDDMDSGNRQDVTSNIEVSSNLAKSQPVPKDVQYSLERYNLIRRMYWVNGQREKASNLPCPIADPPLGYVVLVSHGVVISSHICEGKVSSLTNYLTPISEYYEFTGSGGTYRNEWIADTDGTYGNNPEGIFFFTPDKKYIEWGGEYLYSDTLFIIDQPVLRVKEEK